MCKITISLFLVAILVNLVYSKVENAAKLGDILLKRQLRQAISGCSSGSTQSGAGNLDVSAGGQDKTVSGSGTQSGGTINADGTQESIGKRRRRQTDGNGCAEGNVATQSGSGTGQGSVAGVQVANGAGDSNSGGKFYALGQTVVNK